jgi:UDP-N-acetylmuramoyl-L-alanyl-D-glutamate--2,6-diaminopimelate ligase
MSDAMQPRTLTAAALLAGLAPAPADRAGGPIGTLPVRGLTDDSRAVRPGMAFLAVAGARHDGHSHIDAAVEAGAVLVLAERSVAAAAVPVVVVPQLAALRSELAGRSYGHPSQALYLAAVTGTNGKTSVAHYCCQLLGLLGTPCGYLGTIGWGQLGALRAAQLTTADAVAVQRRLASLQQEGCEAVALEASSHALDQDRLAALAINSALFTNLSRDHLDYHGDFASYAAAKAKLFERTELEQVVLNADDKFGVELLARLAPRRSPALTLCSYGVAAPVAAADAHLGWQALTLHGAGIRGRWCGAWGEADFALPLLGSFAVANVAAAMAVLLHRGVDLHALGRAVERLRGVPGRMEPFVAHGQPTVIVDYAHTPDALQNALISLRAHSAARLRLVFGCGGDRDRGKRPQMAAIAAQHADVVYLTSDNPRTEDPESILDDVAAGLPSSERAHRITDRRQAIEAALADAAPEDLVLVAGKGHEDYQEIGTERCYFSDRDLVRTLLEEAA